MEDIEKLKEEIEIDVIKRKALFRKINSYTGFIVNKISGFSSVFIGVSEFVEPEFLSIVLGFPAPYLIGCGLALLSGKNVIEKISNILDKINE